MASKASLLLLLACFLLAATMDAAYPPEKAPAPEKHHEYEHEHHHHKAPEKHHEHEHHAPPPVKAPTIHYTAPSKAPMIPACVPLCEQKCKVEKEKKRPCQKACTSCCEKSKCVPMGTQKCTNWNYVIDHHGKKLICP